MKCPFCAEEIQDQAVFCRFCGATKKGAGWSPPPQPAPARTAEHGLFGRTFTIRTAAIFFFASAAFGVFGLSAAVPLFGAMRTGAVAALYHLVYVGLFATMGAGLWTAQPWGYWVMVGGTIFYTLDKARYMLDSAAREAELQQQLGALEGLSSLIDPNSITQLMNLLTVLVVLCWWGFVAYLYLNRSYFGITKDKGKIR